jgi:periplasmic copper chaperone A
VKTLTRLVAVLSLALVLLACGEDTDDAVVLDDQVTAAEPDDTAADDAADDMTDDAANDVADDVADAVAAVAVSDVRSRMSPRMAGVAAVYLDIENRSDVDDRLVAAIVAPEVAGIVEIHETFEVDDHGMDDGMDGDAMDGDGMGGHGEGSRAEGMAMMGMREIDAIDLPAGSSVELVPGGLHIMLLDLVADLSPADTFELTLEFAEAGTLTTTVEVREDV